MGLCDSDIAVKFRERIISELSSAKNSYPLVLVLFYTILTDNKVTNFKPISLDIECV